jgi:hypothetical protein
MRRFLSSILISALAAMPIVPRSAFAQGLAIPVEVEFLINVGTAVTASVAAFQVARCQKGLSYAKSWEEAKVPLTRFGTEIVNGVKNTLSLHAARGLEGACHAQLTSPMIPPATPFPDDLFRTPLYRQYTAAFAGLLALHGVYLASDMTVRTEEQFKALAKLVDPLLAKKSFIASYRAFHKEFAQYASKTETLSVGAAFLGMMQRVSKCLTDKNVWKHVLALLGYVAMPPLLLVDLYVDHRLLSKAYQPESIAVPLSYLWAIDAGVLTSGFLSEFIWGGPVRLSSEEAEAIGQCFRDGEIRALDQIEIDRMHIGQGYGVAAIVLTLAHWPYFHAAFFEK